MHKAHDFGCPSHAQVQFRNKMCQMFTFEFNICYVQAPRGKPDLRKDAHPHVQICCQSALFPVWFQVQQRTRPAHVQVQICTCGHARTSGCTDWRQMSIIETVMIFSTGLFEQYRRERETLYCCTRSMRWTRKQNDGKLRKLRAKNSVTINIVA